MTSMPWCAGPPSIVGHASRTADASTSLTQAVDAAPWLNGLASGKALRVSIIYRTTLVPSKLELLTEWLPTRTWYQATGRTPALEKAGGFRLDDPEGEVGIEFMMVTDTSGAEATAYHVPLTYRAGPLEEGENALVGTVEHGVLGRRWVYDGTRDPVLVTQLVALIQGQAKAQAQSESHTPDPTVLARPAADGPVEQAGLAVVDGVIGTEIQVGLVAGGQLVVRVLRVLAPVADEAGELGDYGYVTATWWPAAAARPLRGVVALAELR